MLPNDWGKKKKVIIKKEKQLFEEYNSPCHVPFLISFTGKRSYPGEHPYVLPEPYDETFQGVRTGLN